VAKVGMSNQDRTISLKAAVCSCINKQTEDIPVCSINPIYCLYMEHPVMIHTQ